MAERRKQTLLTSAKGGERTYSRCGWGGFALTSHWPHRPAPRDDLKAVARAIKSNSFGYDFKYPPNTKTNKQYEGRSQPQSQRVHRSVAPSKSHRHVQYRRYEHHAEQQNC